MATVFAVDLMADRTITTHLATRTMRLPARVAIHYHSTRVAVHLMATTTIKHAETVLAKCLVAQAARTDSVTIVTD